MEFSRTNENETIIENEFWDHFPQSSLYGMEPLT
jgi:hypothetical protein